MKTITENELMGILNLSDKEWDALSDNVRQIIADVYSECAEFKRALENVLPYAENEAEALHSLRDSDEAEAEAEVASRAVEYAQELIARAGGAA